MPGVRPGPHAVGEAAETRASGIATPRIGSRRRPAQVKLRYY